VNATIALLVGAIALTGWAVDARRLWSGSNQERGSVHDRHAVRALDDLDRRLVALARAVEAAGSPSDARDLLAALRARSRSIRAKLDSLSGAPEARRGAWAGLGASIAELEYRVDVVWLEVHAAPPSFRAAFAGMVDETAAHLDSIRRTLSSQAKLDHSARLDGIRAELERLRNDAAGRSRSSDERLAVERAEWSRRLAALRRELRALEREFSHVQANRSPRREHRDARPAP
jgi:chromosome segregation ATPase